MPSTMPSIVREIERANWSQGIQTFISILIGAALAVAVGKLQETNVVDADYATRLVSFVLYCAGFFWFYHKFYIFFYRRASLLSILLPAIVGSALIATAHTIGSSYWFWLWSFVLMSGSSYATAATTFNCWRGKYMVIEGLPGTALHLLSRTMLRSALLFAAMAAVTGYVLWRSAIWSLPLSLDQTLFILNGFLYVVMSFLNWLYFSRPLERMVSDNPGAN